MQESLKISSCIWVVIVSLNAPFYDYIRNALFNRKRYRKTALLDGKARFGDALGLSFR